MEFASKGYFLLLLLLIPYILWYFLYRKKSEPHYIDSNKMKEGVIVVDAGIHYLESGIVGDVIPSEKCALISKVPGGVGILTSSLLMQNVYSCYLRRNKND